MTCENRSNEAAEVEASQLMLHNITHPLHTAHSLAIVRAFLKSTSGTAAYIGIPQLDCTKKGSQNPND